VPSGVQAVASRGSRPESVLRLHDVSYAGGTLSFRGRPSAGRPRPLADDRADARRILDVAPSRLGGDVPEDHRPPAYETLRWFLLPQEALAEMQGRSPALGVPPTLFAATPPG
jgi:hypothetical protein